MKTILFFLMIISTAVVSYSQPCGEVEGLKPVQLFYTFDGRPGTTYPMIPSNWNRFYKLNETTGDLTAEGCVFPCCPSVALCVCYVQGTYFRRITPPCDPTPCGADIPLPGMPKTDNNSTEDKWSQTGAWIGGQVPIITASPAIVITKGLQIDANLMVPMDHWLVLTEGNSSVFSGSTIINNSMIRVNPAANLENFGMLKGTGQIYGNLTNSGTLAPGNSPGKFTITGNYTATNTAVHDIEIASSSLFDTVSVEQDLSFASGKAIINGVLNVVLLNGYVPTLGDSYKIFNYVTSTGNFSTLNFPPMPLGLAWTVSYSATDITLNVVGAALPLHFMNLKTAIRNDGIQVDWTAEDEGDVKEYEIERSDDGIKFIKIGMIGTNTDKQYSWLDANPVIGNNYYRVKAIDIDGKFIYSGVLLEKISQSKNTIVYPNPVSRGGSIHVNLNSSIASKIEIVNTMGQILYSKSTILTGDISIPISSAWTIGQYIIRLTMAKSTEMMKLQIR